MKLKFIKILIIGGILLMPTKIIYLSKETEKALNEMVKEAIKENSELYGIEKALIKAIIEHESMNYVFAFRVDYKALKKQEWYNKLLDEKEKKDKKYYASYGLMQVLYGLAKSLGFNGTPEDLFNPMVNIRYGCKYLQRLKSAYRDIKDIIAAYNYGYAKKRKNGTYYNQSYVCSVYEKYKKYGGKL